MIRVPHQTYSKGSEQPAATPDSPSTSLLVPMGTPRKLSELPAATAGRPSGPRFRSGVVLTIRTDKPEAEIGIYDKDGKKLAYETWQAHRQLAETIHQKIQDLLKTTPVKGQTLSNLTGIVVFEGPGSYTGLRIGMSVANALAYSFNISVVAASGVGWQAGGIKALAKGGGGEVALPNYEAPAKTTSPTK